MITNCSGELSFSTLKRVKNMLRNIMGLERLNNLTLMNIEYDLLREDDIDSILNLPQLTPEKCVLFNTIVEGRGVRV